MALQSPIPANATAAIRLKEYLPLVREMSLQRSPADLVRAYRRRAQFVVPSDQNLTITRKGAVGCEVRLIGSSHADTEADAWWRRPQDLPAIESGLLCRLMQGGRPVKMDEIVLEEDDPAAPYLAGMDSLLAAPIFSDGQPLHMVILLRAERAAFTLDDLSMLLLTANLVGQALFQSELSEQLRAAYAALDREFRVVGEIQRELLPQVLPRIPGISLAAHYETSARAGGDYYDFFELPDGNWGLFIADVSGHGAPAAVGMARIHALLHAPMNACPNAATTPIEVLAGLNQCLTRSMTSGHFVTALYGVLDPRERVLRYCIAGHNPPRWFRTAEQRVVSLPPTEGLPLAIVDPVLLTDRKVRFEPGDRLLLYTDGVTETFDGRRDLYGVVRLDAVLRSCHAQPQAIIDAVVADLREYSGGAPPADDRTLVAMAFD